MTKSVQILVPPGVPGNVSASALNNNNNGTDQLTWAAPGNIGSGTYDVQRRQAGQTAWQAAVEVATGTSHDFDKESGTSGSAYDYRVRAKKSGASSDWSSHVSVAGRPGPINDLSATASSSEVAVELSWTAPSNGGKGLTGYRVEWREDATGGWSSNPALAGTTAPGGASSFTVNAGHGLQPGTVYDFRIRADNPDRSSFFSNTAQANMATPANPPGAPTDFRVTAADHADSISIAWTPPADDGGAAIDGYQFDFVEAGTANTPYVQPEFADTVSPATIVHQDISGSLLFLFDNRNWNFRLRACNPNGCGPWSAPFFVEGAPGTPATLTATGGERLGLDPDTVRFTWTVPASGSYFVKSRPVPLRAATCRDLTK